MSDKLKRKSPTKTTARKTSKSPKKKIKVIHEKKATHKPKITKYDEEEKVLWEDPNEEIEVQKFAVVDDADSKSESPSTSSSSSSDEDQLAAEITKKME